MKKRILIIISCVLFIDLFSKYLIFHIIGNEGSKIIIKNFFSLSLVRNFGAAFSSFQNMNLILIFVSLIILGYLLYLLRSLKDTFLNSLSYGLLVGGLLGNLFDRMVFGYVRDFLSFRIFGYDFAIFNFADAAIVVGAILMVLLSFKKEKTQ